MSRIQVRAANIRLATPPSTPGRMEVELAAYLWGSKTETVEEPIEGEEEEVKDDEVKEEKLDEDEEGAVEEEKEEEEKKPKTKKVDKTTWDWELCNQSKPIWTRKPEEIEEGEYEEFYKSITKDGNGPMTQTHFIAEGEVTFKSLLFVPGKQPSESLNKYGQVTKTNDFKDIIPSHLRFIKKIPHTGYTESLDRCG